MSRARATAAIVLVLLAFSGCSDSGGSSASVPATTTTAAPPPKRAPIELDNFEPGSAYEQLHDVSFMVMAAAEPRAPVTIQSPDGRTLHRRVSAAGRIYEEVKGAHKGTGVLSVEYSDDPASQVSVSLVAVTRKHIDEGEAAETAKDKKKKSRPNYRDKLLFQQGAVGLSAAEVRRKLGPPDHTQVIGGQRYWYYPATDNDFQLIFSNGVVTEVNRY